MELKRRERQRELKKRMMKRFLEEEAEVGSDDEEHDDVRKAIDRDGDLEENEEGLDEDLQDFVVHEADDAEVGPENDTIRAKF